MKNLEDQVFELQNNQKQMLEVIKHLSERLKDIEDKENDVKDVLESQAVIDEIIVKNSDDILAIKKTKDINAVAIKTLEAKLETLDKEIEIRTTNLKKQQQESVKLLRENQENLAKVKETKIYDKIVK